VDGAGCTGSSGQSQGRGFVVVIANDQFADRQIRVPVENDLPVGTSAGVTDMKAIKDIGF